MKYEYSLQQPLFTVKNIDILNVERDKNYIHSSRNGRLKHGFIYVVRGSIRGTFFGQTAEEVICAAGDLMFIPMGSSYLSTYLEMGTEIKIIQFDLTDGSLPPYLSTPTKIHLPRASELIHAFWEPINLHTPGHPFYYLSCLYELLWRIDDCYGKLPQKYKKLQGALSELSLRFYNNEKVSYYAALCDMSEVNFRRLFRDYMGMSPIEYRNDLRLNNARAKLQSGEYNVSEAAQSCGFSNLSFFIRLYKKKFGYTPKKE